MKRKDIQFIESLLFTVFMLSVIIPTNNYIKAIGIVFGIVSIGFNLHLLLTPKKK